MRAQFVGKYKGKPVYRVPVLVKLNNSRLCRTERIVETTVLSYSAADAANYVRAEYATRAETEVIAFGPKGGEVYRFIGWESAMFAEMRRRSEPETGLLFVPDAPDGAR
jgi:hypothetical protein